MPLVFSELASTYPPKKVSDRRGSRHPPLPTASSCSSSVKPTSLSVATAPSVATSSKTWPWPATSSIRVTASGFRYAPDALATRMYRTLPDMVEGWTKNLALLFPNPVVLRVAMQLLASFSSSSACPCVLALWLPLAVPWQRWAILVVWLRTTWGFYHRTARSNFPAAETSPSRSLASFSSSGCSIRSWLRHRIQKSVTWKRPQLQHRPIKAYLSCTMRPSRPGHIQ